MVSTTAWISSHKQKPQTRLRLFCFPYAGGGASMYRTWGEDLPAEVEVCPVHLPGRDDRLLELPFTQFSHLIETLTQVLHPYLQVPFAFFGHSMGARIGFELARELRRRHGLSPAHLFVCAARAPHLPNPVNFLAVDSDAAIIEELRRFGGTPEWVLQEAELMQELLPTIRADFQVINTFTYSREAPLDCPISAFGGLQDALVNREHLAAWRKHTRSSFTLRLFPGNHFFLQSARSPLLQAISQELTLDFAPD
jgi:surfactin synthase thioesterase subunit